MLINGGVLRNERIDIRDTNEHPCLTSGETLGYLNLIEITRVSLSIEDRVDCAGRESFPPAPPLVGALPIGESCCSACGGNSGSKPFASMDCLAAA